KRRGHSDGQQVAWTQRRGCACDENLRPSEARAQHCSSAARDVRGHAKASKRNRISGVRVTRYECRSQEKKNSLSKAAPGGSTRRVALKLPRICTAMGHSVSRRGMLRGNGKATILPLGK